MLIFSSPLGRAWEKAVIVSRAIGIDAGEIETADALMECHYGRWQGLSEEQVDDRYPGERALREAKKKWHFRIPGGESYEDLAEGAKVWLEQVLSHSVVVCVAHEMINRAIRGIALNLPTARILKLHQPNDRIIKIENGTEEMLKAKQGAPVNSG